jgi:hypothetical protein
MQFIQLFSIFVLFLVHFDCSQASKRSPSAGSVAASAHRRSAREKNLPGNRSNKQQIKTECPKECCEGGQPMGQPPAEKKSLKKFGKKAVNALERKCLKAVFCLCPIGGVYT